MRISLARHAVGCPARRARYCAALIGVFCVISGSAQKGSAIAPLADTQQTTPAKPCSASAQSTGVTAPMVIREVNPDYTPDAMRAKIEGTVGLEVFVNTDGTVNSVRISRSLDPTFGLDDEAIKAARRWLFRPATQNGKPVQARISIELSFRLKDALSTDSAVPLAWPEAFGPLSDPRGARDATTFQNGWSVVTHELPDMRARIAYPTEWKVDGSFATGALIVSNSQETITLTVSLDAREMSPALLEPVTRPRVQQFSDSVRQRLGEIPAFSNAALQLVAEGQNRLSDRVWLWTDYSASGIAGPPFDGFRHWSFMTQTGARRVEVNCFVKHQRDIAESVFETQVQGGRAVCGQVLNRLSLETR